MDADAIELVHIAAGSGKYRGASANLFLAWLCWHDCLRSKLFLRLRANKHANHKGPMETNRVDEFLKLIAEETGFPREQLTLATKVEDLGIDSLEFVDLIQTIGEKFKPIPDEEFTKIQTVGDIWKAAA